MVGEGASLSAAQLGLLSAVESAAVNGPGGSPTPLPSCPPWSAPGAALSASYNASTGKLQFYGANGAELAASAVVGGTWQIIARGY